MNTTPWFRAGAIGVFLASAMATAAVAAPGNVTGLTATATGAHAIALAWTPYAGGDFARYEVRRGTSAGVTTTSPLVRSDTSISTATFSDAGLISYQTYYYRVFVVDTLDVVSTGVEVSKRTEALTFPHVDSIGPANRNYTVTGAWAVVANGLTDGDAYTGAWHWTDSPGGNYAPSTDASLALVVNLGGRMMPILTFRERYSFETNVDYGYVEVSLDGSSWSRVAFNTGSQTVWAVKQVDLTDWAGNSEVRVRFRVMSNSGTVNSDGWHIDDIAIGEAPDPRLAFPFEDAFDADSAARWITGSWTVVPDGHSPSRGLHESKTGNYPAEAWLQAVSAGVLDLSTARNPVLTFWHKYDLYTNHYYYNEDDYARVYVSADYGRPGSYVQVASYTGSQSGWTRVQVNLGQFAGSSTVRVKFVVDDNVNLNNTAQNTQNAGWWIDDVRIEELPQDVAINPIASSSMHHATLSWTPNADADFALYEIHRATSASVDRSSPLVRTITNPSTVTWTDTVAMIPPTKYSYRIYVVDILGDASLGSNVVTADYSIPLAGFPFADSMNAATNWVWGYPWGVSTSTYHSAPSSWTDSPGASYAANANTALVTRVNLSGSTDPVLTFWHRYALETSADFGLVEISTDGGQTWAEVFRATGVDTAWTSERIDLGTYVGSTIGLRFRVTSNGATQLDGWYVDDVAIADGARGIVAPWSDDVEAGAGSWFATSPWGISEEGSHSGRWHWTDSPTGTYRSNENASLRLTVDLSGMSAPMFRFWERYSFEPNADWGYVEVSADAGANWTQELFVTGSSAVWREEKVDLSPYRGNPRVMIRFRFASNGSQDSDGWHIDDLAIVDVAKSIPYPFVEDFGDTASANWLTSSWELGTGGHSSPLLMHDSPLGPYAANAWSSMALAGTIDLRGTTSPVLTFWHKYDLHTNHYYYNEDDYARVYVSPDNGAVWYSLASWTGTNAAWTKVSIDLSQFVGASAVRVRFTLDDNPNLNNTAQNTQNAGWWIDDVRIEELPRNVTIAPIVSSSTHHATLSWTPNADADFDRYEIYRATTTSVGRSSQLVQTIADRSIVSWTDSVAMIRPTKYSYRIFVIDTLGDASPGSNVVTADYAIPLAGFPFADSMNAATPYWAWGYPWGPATNTYHTAPSSWKTGPGRAYPANANTALETRVNLTGATAPVLTFWHRYAFETAVDFGLVEVSSDGGANWAEVLRVTGIDTMWASERIDLGRYLGGTIALRFRLASDGANQLDGWYVDDVAIADGPRMVSFPWYDDVEKGAGSWFAASPWGLSNVDSRSGRWHWTDSPSGTYAPSTNTALNITVDLSGAQAPILRFWERYSFEPNADWGYVEVSADAGANWTQEFFLTGSSASWREERIDLSPYRGNPSVIIRFRIASNGANQSDGWHLDDFSIVDVARQMPYPFSDAFADTSSLSNWLTSSWEQSTGGRSAPYLMHDSPLGPHAANAWSSMALAGTIDLRGTTSPVLTFWHKYDLYTNHYYYNEDDYARVYVSPDNGAVWYSLASWTGTNAAWTKVSIDLSQFVGASAVRVRFTLDDNPNLNNTAQNTQNAGWWIDDVRIGDNIAAQALADSVRIEGPAVAFAVPGLASPRYVGRVYEPNLTPAAGKGANVVGEFGIGPPGAMPGPSWTWFAAGWLDDASGFDRFFGTVRADSAGTYAVAFRGSIDGGVSWVYADLDGNNLAGGGVNEYTVARAAKLYVGRGASARIETAAIARDIRRGAQEMWSFALASGGPDALVWAISEARATGASADIPWMVLQKTGGVLPAGERAVIGLVFDATGLIADSTYTAALILTSNDAARDSIVVPVALAVYPEGTPEFSGVVVIRGGGPVDGGSIVLSDADGVAVDTLEIGTEGRFLAHGAVPGTYRLDVAVPGAYPQPVLDVAVPATNMTIEVTPLHPIAASPFSMDVWSDASTLDGAPLPVGSVVTVRDPDGVVCGIGAVAIAGRYGLVHVYADDPVTPEVDEGAIIGDSLWFYVNDVPTGQRAIYLAHHTIRRVDLAARSVALRRLAAGLHLISLAATPRDSSIGAALASIAGKYSYVAGFDLRWGGARTYVDSLALFSDLGVIDGRHGYWIRMDEPGDLVPLGVRIHDDTPLALAAGWNLVSYLPAAPLPPARALASAVDRLRVVGGFDAGARTFVPGSAFNTLDAMRHGYGYWLYATGPATLVYRNGARSVPLAKPATPDIATGDGPVPTPEWTDFYGVLAIDGRPAPAGTEVSLRDAQGTLCARTALRTDGLYGFLHAYGDDPRTDADEGARSGEPLALFVDGRAVTGTPSIVWTGAQSLTRVDLALATSPTGISGANRPLRFAFGDPRPNPFNAEVALPVELITGGRARIVVFDGLGRRVRTISDGELAAGAHTVVWDGRDDAGRTSASGAYVIRLTAPDGVLSRRVVLAR